MKIIGMIGSEKKVRQSIQAKLDFILTKIHHLIDNDIVITMIN